MYCEKDLVKELLRNAFLRRIMSDPARRQDGTYAAGDVPEVAVRLDFRQLKVRDDILGTKMWCDQNGELFGSNKHRAVGCKTIDNEATKTSSTHPTRRAAGNSAGSMAR